MNIIVVGAGPAGNTAAKELARAGHTVDVFEEHQKIGRPIACTGIVTKAIFDFATKSEEYIVNELEGVQVIAPSKKQIDIPLHEWVICREKFDGFLAEEAKQSGAKYHVAHKFFAAKDGSAMFTHKNETYKKEYDILIGADGPFSAVGRSQGMIQERKFYIGSQATISGSFDPKWFTTFFGRCAPGFFAWSVPESASLSRVGVATKKGVYEFFNLLRKKYNGTIVERQAGPIPIYDGAKQVRKNNIFLVGDAAGLCKNTTGGGIITGMWSAKVASECINKARDYSVALAPLKKELWLHQKLREILNEFSDDDYEKLVDDMSKRKVKEILQEYPREYPSRFLWKLIVAQPKLLRFGKHALRKVFKGEAVSVNS